LEDIGQQGGLLAVTVAYFSESDLLGLPRVALRIEQHSGFAQFSELVLYVE
jgi:hypothetical protein